MRRKEAEALRRKRWRNSFRGKKGASGTEERTGGSSSKCLSRTT
jgi:hypothetical protein